MVFDHDDTFRAFDFRSQSNLGLGPKTHMRKIKRLRRWRSREQVAVGLGSSKRLNLNYTSTLSN